MGVAFGRLAECNFCVFLGSLFHFVQCSAPHPHKIVSLFSTAKVIFFIFTPTKRLYTASPSYIGNAPTRAGAKDSLTLANERTKHSYSSM